MPNSYHFEIFNPFRVSYVKSHLVNIQQGTTMKNSRNQENAKAMQTELDEYDFLLFREPTDQLLLGLCMGLTSGLAEIEFQAAAEEEQLEREWQLRERFLQAQTDYYDNLEEETPKRAA